MKIIERLKGSKGSPDTLDGSRRQARRDRPFPKDNASPGPDLTDPSPAIAVAPLQSRAAAKAEADAAEAFGVADFEASAS